MEIELLPQITNFTGKVVLVTGGRSGIGAGIAMRFAQAGAHVAICSLHPADELCETIRGSGKKCIAIAADVTDPAQVQSVFDQIASTWSAVDILINNAGIYPLSDFLSLTPEEWSQTLETNLNAVFLCTQTAARGMVAAGKAGAVINIGSTEAVNPAFGHCHYATAKAGVVMFSRAAALELGKYNIRVNTISPGLINRPTLQSDWPDGYQRFIERAPLGRVGEPQDIADACLFLASDAARWITGAHLVVDGGVLTSPAF